MSEQTCVCGDVYDEHDPTEDAMPCLCCDCIAYEEDPDA